MPVKSAPDAQGFLRELDKNLWSAADRLRANLDAAVYKHAVLGVIFLKYVSDSFAMWQREIEAQLRDPQSDYFLDPTDFKSVAAFNKTLLAELEERDYYLEKNVFWVPALAHWQTLQDSAKLPPGTEIEVKNGKTTIYKITSTGCVIDTALDVIERRTLTEWSEMDSRRLPAGRAKRGKFIEEYGGQLSVYGQDKSARRKRRFGLSQRARRVSARRRARQSNPTTWRFAAMNMAIRGIDFTAQRGSASNQRDEAIPQSVSAAKDHFGKEPANSCTSDQHLDLRADYVMPIRPSTSANGGTRSSKATCAGATAPRRAAMRTSPGASTCSTTSPHTAAWLPSSRMAP